MDTDINTYPLPPRDISITALLLLFLTIRGNPCYVLTCCSLLLYRFLRFFIISPHTHHFTIRLSDHDRVRMSGDFPLSASVVRQSSIDDVAVPTVVARLWGYHAIPQSRHTNPTRLRYLHQDMPSATFKPLLSIVTKDGTPISELALIPPRRYQLVRHNGWSASVHIDNGDPVGLIF